MKWLKTFKEDVVFIPLGMAALVLFRFALHAIYPESALYDMGSEWESILFTVIKTSFYALFAWLLLRVAFPSAYKHMKQHVYDGFWELSNDAKTVISLALWALLFIAMIILSN